MQSRSGTQDAPGGMAVDLLEVTCLRKQPLNEPRKTNAKARLRARRRVSSCAKRSSIFVKANMERDLPSRQSPLDCQRHAAPESICRRRSEVRPPSELDVAQQARTKQGKHATARSRPRDRVQRGGHLSTRGMLQLPRRRWLGMLTRRRLRKPHPSDRRPRVKQSGQRARRNDQLPHARPRVRVRVTVFDWRMQWQSATLAATTTTSRSK